MITTLNHCMWIHQHHFRMDEWMLYETDSPVAGLCLFVCVCVGGCFIIFQHLGVGRAMIFGRLWTRDGRLVMTTSQEGVVRAKL
jgi:acyl-CoA thioesterase